MIVRIANCNVNILVLYQKNLQPFDLGVMIAVLTGRARSMSVARPRATSVAAPRGAHVCTQCDKSFQTLGGLSKHERVHLRGLG